MEAVLASPLELQAHLARVLIGLAALHPDCGLLKPNVPAAATDESDRPSAQDFLTPS